MARLIDLDDTPEPDKVPAAPAVPDTPAPERWRGVTLTDKHRIRQAAKALKATDLADKVRLMDGVNQEHVDAATEGAVLEQAAAKMAARVQLVALRPKTLPPSGAGALVKRILGGEKQLAPRPPRLHVVQRRPGYPATVKAGPALLGHVLWSPKGFRPHIPGTGPFAPYPTEQEAIDFILEHALYPE